MSRFPLVEKKRDTRRKMRVWNRKNREKKREELKKRLKLRVITDYFK